MFKRIAQKLRPSNPQLTEKIRIEYGELLAQEDCEAILFFMRPQLDWGGSLNRAILRMAGAGLDKYVLEYATTPRSGEVFVLPAFGTGYKAIFMAILADWDGGNGFEERDLLNCYRLTIEKAQETGIKTLGVPAMGRDKRDFPHIRFARLTIKGILERLDDRTDFVKIMCIDRTMMGTYNAQLQKVRSRNPA